MAHYSQSQWRHLSVESLFDHRVDIEAPGHLDSQSIDDIVRILVNGNGEGRRTSYQQDPFIAQLDMFGLTSDSEMPETIFFTTNSAVPMADVARGIYRAAGIPKDSQPALLPIHGKVCKESKSVTAKSDIRHALLAGRGNTVSKLYREIRTLADGTSHALVIDQYRATGKTVDGAAAILEKCGVERIQTLTGNWYHQAPYDIDVDITNMTSNLAAPLQEIGELCFEAFCRTG